MRAFSRSPDRWRLDGAPTALPRPFDALSERWFRAGPRLRLVLLAVIVTLAAAAFVVRMSTSPWGPPVEVLVTATDLPLGGDLTADEVRTERWPADLVPEDAVRDLSSARLTVAAPAGTVLTARHLADDGIAGALPSETAGVAIPREQLPRLPAGSRIDLVGAGPDGGGTVLAAEVGVLRVDDVQVWVAVPRERAAEVAGAAAGGALTAVVLPP